MKARLFDHIDLRVRDRAAAARFYGRLLPELGFSTNLTGETWGAFEKPGDKPRDFFGFTEAPDHQPNGNRIAFWAETRAEVDRLGKLLPEIGAQNIEGPELCVDYSPGYYAVFFEDPSGNKLEVCCRQSAIVAD